MGLFKRKKQSKEDSSKSMRDLIVRDKRMNLDHFLNFISGENDRIQKFETSLNAGEITEDRIPSIKKWVFDIKLSKLVAMYSAGFPNEELKSYLEQLLDNIQISVAKNRYREFLKLISLCVLLDVDNTKALALIERADRDGLKDALFDFIAKHYDEDREISASVLHKKPYEVLLKIALGESTDPVKELHTFHSRWYASHQDTGWYNSHKDEKNARTMYRGYWAFEIAAFVKIHGLEEGVMEGKDYYPFGF